MSRLLLTALLCTACAPEVAPRADPGDPRVLPVGATAALDGSFSEGDGLTYAWAVEPEGATILDAESPFATLLAEAPGFYTLSLEVCDAAGRCDVAETWARVDDAPGSASRISSWSPDTFAGSKSGAGSPLGAFTATPEWCKKCLDMADETADEWDEFCSSGLPKPANDGDKRECGKRTYLIDQERRNDCYARGCEK